MNYSSEGFCRYEWENSTEKDKVSCPINEKELLCKESEQTPNNNTEASMMKKIQETEFSLVDLNLFLDTHPDCKEALELFTQLSATLKSLKADYVSKYGPLYATDSVNATPFQWVDPGRKWPWQI